MKTYTVRQGDTLQFISMRFFGTFIRWPELWHANREVIERAQQCEACRLRNMTGPDWIFPGTVLTIPTAKQ